MRRPSDRPRDSIRIDARLDQVTRAKVDELARLFHQPRAALVRHIMHWGLDRGALEKIDQGDAQGPIHHLFLYVDAILHAQAQDAAHAAGVDLAPWLRHMVRRISVADFPPRWQEARSENRSHDSRDYDTRFMLRLDEVSRTKLDALVEYFHVSKADIIRQLITQATPDDFPTSWQLRANEPRPAQTRQIVPR
jgi:hypothetical protein